MSREQIEHLLQECLEGFDAGLSPEECLSAYPHVRAELEPMFRQALSLRFAFAASPSEEFKRRGRESLMFHAGREVSQSLSKEPDRERAMDLARSGTWLLEADLPHNALKARAGANGVEHRRAQRLQREYRRMPARCGFETR